MLYQSVSRIWLSCGLVCLLVLFAGCEEPAPPSGTISGLLTVGDEPFGSCKVCIQNATGGFGNRAAQVKDDGTFELVKVPVGEYLVMIAPIPEIEDPMDPTPRPKSSEQVFEKIDRKYSQYKTSGLTVSVKADEVTSMDLKL